MLSKIVLFWLITIVACYNQLPKQQPVIGIYTQDYDDDTNFNSVKTYIPASYRKFLEMAGAQVIPIFYRQSYDEIESLLSKINGILFPGGEMPIFRGGQWTDKMVFIIDYISKQNKQGNVYPIWATCRGLQAVTYITSQRNDNSTILKRIDGQDKRICPLIIKSKQSYLLNSLSQQEYKQATQGQGLFYYHHFWAVLLETYESSSQLKNFWKLISTSKNPDGVQFISTLQAKEYPYFMTQYHPQKNSFEWRIPAKRSYIAISASQKYVNTFMQKARMNSNHFEPDQLSKRLLNNFQPNLTPINNQFVQIYFFDQ